MDEFAEQRALFARLLRDAARRADEMLASPGEAVRLRCIADDGFSAIERLELSALVEDQLVAVALRLAVGGGAARPVAGVLDQHFLAPASTFAIEAQRRALWNAGDGAGLPFDQVAPTAALIEERIGNAGGELACMLRAYAALYSDLWCDPRIGASAAARREMLALVSVLYARERALCGHAGHRGSGS